MRHVLCCSLLLVSGGVNVAWSAPAPSAGKTLNWAERMFTELDHDFGVVTRGADVRHRIAITNPFGEVISLHGAKSTCGCTTPELSTNQLQPNETGYLELKLNTVKFTGSKNPNVDVTLSFGGGARTTVRIPIKAYIRGDVTTSEDVVDFGVVAAGHPQTRTMSVTYHGSAPWKITGVRNNGQGLSVEVADPVRQNGKTTYRLNVTLGDDLAMGNFERSLVVLTEEPSKSFLTMKVRAKIEPKIVVANPVIQLGAVQPGATLTTRVIVRGQQPFSVEAVNCAGGMASCDLSKMSAKAVHVLPLTITAPEVSGRFAEEVLLKIAGEGAPVSCRVEGEVLATRGTSRTLGAVR